VSLQQCATFRLFETGLQAASRLFDDRVLTGFHPLHVRAHAAMDHDAVFGRPPGHVRSVGARDQRFGWGAASVDAGAPDKPPLDDGYPHARSCQPHRQRRPGLTGADDDRIVVGHEIRS